MPECGGMSDRQTAQECWAKTILLSETGHVLSFLDPILILQAEVTY
jgi:hypothetical protein